MSIHSSLRSTSTLSGERSVFTRIERLAVLKKDGRFKEETGSVYGLPKVRTRFKVAGAKKAAKAEKAPAAGAGGAAAPAAGAKAAAPAAAAKPAAKK
ncbi:MAG: small basic protein [Planctomycetes bacterium]|nr:small basic protein [Planctomycetota bacterium]